MLRSESRKSVIRTSQSRWGLAVLLSLMLLGLSPVLAQMPVQLQTPSTGNQSAVTPAAEKQDTGGKEDEAELREKLAAAEAELGEINTPETLGKGTPPGVSEAELQERRSLLQRVVRAYDQRIDQAGKIEKARLRRAESERTASGWQGFKEPPPYPVTMVDELWNSIWVLTRTVDTAEVKLKLMTQAGERGQDALRNAEERLRKSAERLEGVREGPDAAKLAWAHELAQLRVRSAGATAVMHENYVKIAREELAEARQRLALTQRQFEIAQQHASFSKEDLDKIYRRLDEERQALERETDRALSAHREAARAFESAERRLREVRAAAAKSARGQVKAAATLIKLEEDLELKRAQLDTLNLQLEVVKQLMDVTVRERRLWGNRFAIEQEDDPVMVRDTYQGVLSTWDISNSWRDYIRQQAAAVQGQIGELENRIRNAAPGTILAHQRNLLEAYRDRETLHRRWVERVDTYIRLVERWKFDLERRRQAMSFAHRFREWGGILTSSVRQVWDFELFTAEDTIEVDGRQITGRRSVTVGKTARALVTLIVAYWASLLLARLAQRIAVKRLGMDANLADLFRKWTLAVLFSVLVVASLMYVKIPLTVFAFLGGALAIGVGFGTQTMLKNFISGLLLLIERPMRVGDLIEVGGLRGVVTTIGFRSSTVRDANGMEMHVPNSALLEQNLSNWTYSSPTLRWSLKVGVAYGSPVSRVLEILEEVVEGHSKVLKDPAPTVFFEDFGDSALLFGMYFWLEFGRDFNPLLVGSELRIMIDKRFAEEGIIIAFPQRDVHVDSAKPLQVQLMGDSRLPSCSGEAPSPPAALGKDSAATHE